MTEEKELLGCTLCFKCKIPFEEYSEMRQHDWHFRMTLVDEGTPGVEWQEMPCPMHKRVHKFPVLVESWCPPCSEIEMKRVEREGHEGHEGHPH